MNQAQYIIPRLRRLAEIEKAHRQLKDKESCARASLADEIESLRAVLPTSILNHHDSRRARGKISVAPVTRGICGACHLAIPRGHLSELRRIVDDLSVCDQCGVFIYLADEQITQDDSKKPAATRLKKTARAKRAPQRIQTDNHEPLPA